MNDNDTTAADIYRERREQARELGIDLPDRYGDDELDDETDPTGNRRHWRRINAEKDAWYSRELKRVN